jgi:TolA-binding protein
MRPRAWLVGVFLGMAATAATAAAAVSVPDRLWTVGVQAFEDGLYDLAYRELTQFARVANGDPRRGDAAVLRGKAAFALGRYAEALTEFQAAEGLPLRAFSAGEPLFWGAEVLFRVRRFGEARDKYTEFLRGNASSSYADDALYARGFSELELGLPDEALATFTTLLQEHPNSELAGSAAYAVARELVRTKRWDEALALLSAYATRFPQSRFQAEVRYLLGVTQIEVGRTAEGARTLGQFVSAEPSHELAPSARTLLAEAHVKSGRVREALDEYRALVKYTPTSPLVPQALYQIGTLAQQMGRPADAEVAWRTLRREYPGDALNPLAGLELANLYAKRRQWDQALEVSRDVANGRGKERLEALLLLGDIALKAGKAAEAETGYATALAEAPDGSAEHFRALAGVGLVNESRRQNDAARRAYEEIVAKAEDQELVQWAKGRIEGIEEREKPPPPKPTPKPAPRAKPQPAPKPGGGS